MPRNTITPFQRNLLDGRLVDVTSLTDLKFFIENCRVVEASVGSTHITMLAQKGGVYCSLELYRQSGIAPSSDITKHGMFTWDESLAIHRQTFPVNPD